MCSNNLTKYKKGKVINLLFKILQKLKNTLFLIKMISLRFYCFLPSENIKDSLGPLGFYNK